MRIEKPINVPIMTEEQKKAMFNRVNSITPEEIEEHQKSKPQFPKDFDTDDWNVE